MQARCKLLKLDSVLVGYYFYEVPIHNNYNKNEHLFQTILIVSRAKNHWKESMARNEED